MTSRGHVVIAAGYPNTVFKYTADTKLERQIKLSNNILLVSHAIETSTGTSILISCDYKTASKFRHPAVCEVTDEGHIIRSFDIQSLWDSVIVTVPFSWSSMTTDADSNVYFLGKGGQQVIILDSRLNLRRVIQTRGVLRCLTYSQETKQLIVGHCDKSCISIITIQ